MFFGKPILAHKTTAIPETLGDGGFLFDKNDRIETLELLRGVLQEDAFAQRLRAASTMRAQNFSKQILADKFERALGQILDQYHLQLNHRWPTLAQDLNKEISL
jgi:glycosyltransferase involved in cell wall biosynthesis